MATRVRLNHSLKLYVCTVRTFVCMYPGYIYISLMDINDVKGADFCGYYSHLSI